MNIAADIFDMASLIPEFWDAFASFILVSRAGGAPVALVNATVFVGTIVSEVCWSGVTSFDEKEEPVDFDLGFRVSKVDCTGGNGPARAPIRLL